MEEEINSVIKDNNKGHDLPKLPLDHDVPSHVLARRRAIASCSSVSTEGCQATSGKRKDKRRGGISIERDERHEVVIRFTSGNRKLDVSPELQSVLSTLDLNLLKSLNTGEGKQRRTGRFLTLQQPRKASRALNMKEFESHSSLEDCCYRQTKKILSKVGEWNFNTFILDTMSGGRSLPTLLFHLFQQYGLMETFDLDVVKVWKCFGIIEDGYHSNNPYHNAVHATDVTQAMHCFLQEKKILRHITPLEVMTSLLAAVTHDLDHPGVNQPFLIATSNHLASLYRNSSVLENHHWRSALCCLSQSGMLNHLDRMHWEEITFQIRSLILATDITRQHEFLMRFQHYMEKEMLNLEDHQYRHFILQIALKCADICNPCRPWEISTRWSRRVCEEFFRQGDVERQLNIPVTSFCDRNATSIAKIQSGFFRCVVAPLFKEWDLFLQTPLSSALLKNLNYNQEKWDSIVAQEHTQAIKEKTEENNQVEKVLATAVAAATSVPEESSSSSVECDLSGVMCDRRHSIPRSLPGGGGGGVARTLPHTDMLRRHSAIWTSSLSTIASNVAEDLFSSSSSIATSKRYLTKQNTFPPLPPWRGRLHQQQTVSVAPVTLDFTKEVGDHETRTCLSISENGEKATSDRHCPNNGCNSPSVFDSAEGKITDTETLLPLNDDQFSLSLKMRYNAERESRLISLTRRAAERKGKPLIRLKSDSDLLQHNGKVLFGAKSSMVKNREEKENANPFMKTWQWRNSCRKMKSQGVGIIVPRLLGRRGSAPVGMIREDLINTLNEGPEFLEQQPRRRDSAPVDLLQEQLVRLQQSIEKRVSEARRGSLPSEVKLNSKISLITDILLPNTDVCHHCRTSGFLTTSLRRRRSMPTDLMTSGPELFRKLSLLSSDSCEGGQTELFPTPMRSYSSSGVDGSCQSGTLKRNDYLNLWFSSKWPGKENSNMCQVQPFDTTFSDSLPTSDEQVYDICNTGYSSLSSSSSNCNVWNVENRKSVFPFHRRSSVPAGACLFASSSDEDH